MKAHRKRVTVLTLGVFLALDWVFVDRWQVKGRVVDAASGESVANAWVFADFSGEKPLINLPLPPHPNSRTGTCMGARLARTDHQGRFHLDKLEINRQLANKSAYIVVFKPDWLARSQDSDISSSLLGWAPSVVISLEAATGMRKSTTYYPSTGPASVLSPNERSYSDELRGTLSAVMGGGCSHEGFELSAIALRRALDIAETYDERERVRASCGYVRDAAPRLNARRFERKNWFLRFEPDYVWPFDCDNLPFKKQPSAEALAVEAELQTIRRARRPDKPPEGVQ